MSNKKPAIQPSNPDPNDEHAHRDFKLVGNHAWLRITPPAKLKLKPRTADLEITTDDQGFHVQVYYVDDMNGGDTIIDSLNITWAELEAAWQKLLMEDA